MPFAPKSYAPLATQVSPPPLVVPAITRAAAGGVTAFAAPGGYLRAADLATALRERRRLAWLRLGPEDRDPAALLISLIAALQRLAPGAGAATLSLMRRQPGPVAGWPALFASLASELSATLGPAGAIVVEGCQQLSDAPGTLRLLSAHLLSDLPPDTACVLTAERPLVAAALPAHTIFRGAGDLRLKDSAALSLREWGDDELPGPLLRRANALAEGRAEVIAALWAAGRAFGAGAARQAVDRAGSLDDLLGRLAQLWLVVADEGGQAALGAALRIGYAHPSLFPTAPPEGPWLEALEDGWSSLPALWREPLRRALRHRAAAAPHALRHLSEALLSGGAVEQAVPLALELGDRAGAARAIARVAPTLVDLGQWQTLEEWLCQLSAQALGEWPGLVYISGELSAAQGHTGAAQRAFSMATRLYGERHDAPGACLSLLAESTVAAWRGDRPQAEARAQAALALAESAGLHIEESWAAWQLGCLAVAAEELDGALAQFERAAAAAAAAQDTLMLDLPLRAEQIALRQRDLRGRREFHRRTYLALEQAEQEAAEELRALLAAAADGVDTLLEARGWARLPLMLKLALPEAGATLLEASAGTGVWGRLLAALGLGRREQPEPIYARELGGRPQVIAAVAAVGQAAGVADGALPPAGPAEVATAPGWSPAPRPWAPAGEAPAPDDGGAAAMPAPAAAPAEPPQLTVQMLGSFRALLNEEPVPSPPGGRARSLLEYLLVHRAWPVPREVLMEQFWPDASPESARNNLNVALHAVRQAFRARTEAPVIIYKGGAYGLSPELRVWVDLEEFEQRAQAARRLEEAGQSAEAAAELESAIALYQDDLLVDEPYEEWAVLTRERLRVIYLEALDRLSQISFAQGRYGLCAGLCQRILDRDSCREDAHARLMRCHSRQGQPTLALRQYQICVEALRRELDLEPSPSTAALYERIRRREAV